MHRHHVPPLRASLPGTLPLGLTLAVICLGQAPRAGGARRQDQPAEAGSKIAVGGKPARP